MPIRRTTAANLGSVRTEFQAWSTLRKRQSGHVLVGRFPPGGPGPPHDCRLVHAGGRCRGGKQTSAWTDPAGARRSARATATSAFAYSASVVARERPRRVLIALHHVGLSARLGRTREVAAPPVDVGDAKQRPGILLLFGRDGLVHPQGLVQASSLQQEIPEHYPRLEVAGISDERALGQRRGFVGTPDGHEEEGDRVPHDWFGGRRDRPSRRDIRARWPPSRAS